MKAGTKTPVVKEAFRGATEVVFEVNARHECSVAGLRPETKEPSS